MIYNIIKIHAKPRRAVHYITYYLTSGNIAACHQDTRITFESMLITKDVSKVTCKNCRKRIPRNMQ